VLIVGGGPAGVALAWQLSRQGIPLTLVEASRSFERAFRGQGLMPSGLEALAALGLDPWPPSVPRRPLGGWSFVVNSRPLFTVREPMGSPVPCTLIEQGALLRHWPGRLEQRPGVRRICGQPVVALLEANGRVTGVELADGRQLTAPLVVACDGQGSRLRALSGLPYAGGKAPLEVLWFRLRGEASGAIADWLGDRFVTLVGERGSGALFRRADAGVQLGWSVQEQAEAQEQAAAAAGAADWLERWAAAAPADLAALLRALPPQAVRGPRRLPGRVGLAGRWQRPGLLLLGDAAHPMSPLRAQGLNMALRDAVVAAALLAPALAGGGAAGGAAGEAEVQRQALDAVLPRIEAARRPEIEAVQALQAEEAGRAELLRNPWLRGMVAASAPLSGPLLARRWRASQRVLRDGLAPLGLER
jgi:2-polyprenyl-6-methoxyphenol hydroxylase-like FAD-dependent oxidoreductase